MWNPIQLKIKNLGTHSNTELNFVNDELSLVYGTITDSEGVDSNGSGKSTLIKAITFALLGEITTDVDNDDLIKDGTVEASIYFHLKNTYFNQDLEIFRTLKRGSSSKVLIKCDGKIEDQLTSVVEANKYILEVIQITKQDLLTYFIINQGESNSFFTNNDAKQKEIIGRFANFSFIDLKLETLKATLSETLQIKQNMERQKQVIEGVLVNLEQQKEEELEILETEIKDNTIEYDKTISSLQLDILSIQGEVESLEHFVVVCTEVKQKATNNLGVFDQLELELKQRGKDIKEKEKDIFEGKKLRKELELEFHGLITCPGCDLEFLPPNSEYAHLNKEELEKILAECNAIIKGKMGELTEMQLEIGEINTQLEKKIKIKTSIAEQEDYIENAEFKIKQANHRIKSIKNDIKRYEALIEKEKESQKDKSNLKAIETKIAIKTTELQSKETGLVPVLAELQTTEAVIYHLGNKGFKSYLVNKVVKVIERYINTYLQKLRVDLVVTINGYKKLKSGELREKIEVFLGNSSSVKQSRFERFSGGERMRAVGCSILTLQKLINSNCSNGGLNLLILDEVIDHLDRTGIDLTLNMLASNKSTILVVTHSKDLETSNNFNKVLVTKKGKDSFVNL